VRQKLEIFPEEPVAIVTEALPPEATRPVRALADDLDTVAKRVRTHLWNMSATILEIGRELRTVKRRLKQRQFHDWVARTFGLAANRAELMIRAAVWAEGREKIVSHLDPTAIYTLFSSSTPESARQEVLFRLERGERPLPRVVKEVIRAAKRDPYGSLPDSYEEEIAGLLKYCGYKTVPDHLAQYSTQAISAASPAVDRELGEAADVA
jgi:hypothetical protein